MAGLPLEGIRVVEMTLVWAGPYATLLLGDMGAQFIRVESLQHPDVNTRGQPRISPSQIALGASGFPNGDPGQRPWERGSNFNYTGRHKFSVTMDLERPKGKEMFLRLIQKSDVFLTNYAAATWDKLGLTYPVLREANPQIIHVSLPGFGNTGPYKYIKGWGGNMEAVVGHNSIRGYLDMDFTGATGVVHSDAAAGATAAFAVMAALHYRNRTGKGQFVDMSQAENVSQHFFQAFMDYSMNRRVQSTMGNRHPFMAPHGVYPGQGEDAWLALSIGSEEEWQALCRVMGKPELAEDERFRDPLVRHRHQDDLDPIISEWSQNVDPYQAMHLLQKEGVTAGPVLHHKEVFQDPHLRARGFFQSVTSPATGTHDYPGPLFQMSKTPLSIRRPAPLLGEHNEYVYKQIIGVSDEEYEELVRERHIGDTYVELLGEE